MQDLTTLEKDLSCATRTRLPLAKPSFNDPSRSSLVSRAICLSLACAPYTPNTKIYIEQG